MKSMAPMIGGVVFAAMGITAFFYGDKLGQNVKAARDEVPAIQNVQQARLGFATTLKEEIRDTEALAEPPESSGYSLVRYPTTIGEMSGYLAVPSTVAGTDQQRPAMVWLGGGCPVGGRPPSPWNAAAPETDTSAAPFLDAGMVVFYPTTRGVAGNPGAQEGFFGEVDDVLAALEFMRGHDNVIADRVYLGGHDSGATLALLVAASTDEVEAVVAYGPTADPTDYPSACMPADLTDPREVELRSPGPFLNTVVVSALVIEGRDGHVTGVAELQDASQNPQVIFVPIKGANHFDAVRPINQLLANRFIAAGLGQDVHLSLTELQGAFDRSQGSSSRVDR